MQEPFNPLDKLRLAESIARALLQRPLAPMPMAAGPVPTFRGAGVYAIYFQGQLEPYRSLLDQEAGEERPPIYVGKAIPSGGRVGGIRSNSAASDALFRRLKEHAKSIDEANNLSLDDFWCRHLVVDDIFIPLGENRLIDLFQPIWNVRLSGFGNHPPGGRRELQHRSPWDTVHPGRPWAARLGTYPRTADEIWTMLRQGLAVVGPADEEVQLGDATSGETPA